VTPSKEVLEAKAKQFANIVFAVGAGVLIFSASLLQSAALNLMGPVIGEHITFIVATIGIFFLAGERSRIALFAIVRQCEKYGHTLSAESEVCSRCFRTISKSQL
jgi:hypothetical protein